MIAHPLTLRSQPLLATGQAMLLDIPDCDFDEFLHQVPREERARVRELFEVFREMLAARSAKAGAVSAALKRQHRGWGWSAKTFRALFAAYRDGGHKPGDFRKRGAIFAAGDWRVLLRDYKGFESNAPEEFKRWLGEQWAQFRGRKDCVEATWRHVIYEIWLKGHPVPGYGTVDAWAKANGRHRPHPQFIRIPQELPDGWSLRTFRRHLPKRRATREQLAHGYLAAHNAQPDQVLTDRGPLLPLQYIFLDDSRPDVRCTWFGAGGKGEIVYPLLVMGLDACSGVDLEAVTKPRALNEATGGKHGVTQDMALRVVIGVLRRFGLPPWPITFVHENAAACVPSEARRALQEIYGDRIQFEATGIFRQRMMEHGFTEQGGAPYDKAPIEAFWRILMTQLARLAGATGPRYDTAHGELAQIEKYTLGLIEKAGGIEAVFARFRSPLLDFAECDAAIMAALRLLRFRGVHKLQGFERLKEWRRSPAEGYRPWSEFLALAPEEQNAIASNGDEHAIISRLECPAERFCRKLQGVEMTAVDDDLLTWIEGPRQPVRVRDGKIAVRDAARFGDDEQIFRETDHPLLDAETEGEEFEAAIARDGSRIVLTRDGRILGSVARQGRVVRGTDDWRREAGRIAAARKADREHLRGYYLADTDEALAALQAHNDAVDAAPELAAATQNAEPKTRNAPERLTAAAKRRNEHRARQRAAQADAALEQSSQ